MNEANEQGELICPFCLVVLKDDGRCPVCDREICEEHWSVHTDRGDFSPCRSQGLVSPSECGYPYQQREVDVFEVKPYETKETFKSERDGKVLTIGGSARFSIAGLANYHCVVFRKVTGDKKDCGWWIFDSGKNCTDEKGRDTGKYVGTKVNRCPIRLRKLCDQDIIEIVSSVKYKCNIGENGEIVVEKFMGENSDDLALEVKGLSAQVGGKKLLSNVSFDVKRGEFIGIIGRSGCGKSSLIQRLANLAPFSGEVTIFGEKLSGDEPYGVVNADVVYLPQNVEMSLHESMTLDEEIRSISKIFNCKDDDKTIDDILKRLDLFKKRGDLIKDFSGGEKRRVGIALALMRNPKMLLLDEPCAGLDPAMTTELMEYLFKLSKIDGKTILCVTHVFDNEDLFDKLLVLRKGEKSCAYFDVPQKIYSKFHRGTLAEVFDVLDDEGANSCRDKMDISASSGINDYLQRCRCFLQMRLPQLLRWWCKQWPKGVCRDLSSSRFWSYMEGYWLRNWRGYCPPATRKSPSLVCWAKVKGFCVRIKTPVRSFVVQPALIVVFLRLACAFCFREGGKFPEISTLSFCASLSVFWLALNNSACELVRERVPGRCLERLGGVPMLPYLASKYLWVMLLCVIQCLAFMILFAWTGTWNLPFVQLRETGVAMSIDEISRLSIPFASYLPLLASSILGASCGLTISAFARKDIGAVRFVPNCAIAALLFSEAIMRFMDNYSVPYCATVAQWLMPCHWPHMVLTDIIENVNEPFRHFAKVIAVVVVYGVLSFVMTFFAQRCNERSWQGR